MYIYIYKYIFIYTYIYIYMYTFNRDRERFISHIYIYVYAYMYIYIYIHTYIHTHMLCCFVLASEPGCLPYEQGPDALGRPHTNSVREDNKETYRDIREPTYNKQKDTPCVREDHTQ